jgi:predicted DNA-binding transcriptional regulator AlpA
LFGKDEWFEEEKACEESSKLFRFLKKADDKYHKLELLIAMNEKLREVAEQTQLEVLDEVKNKITRFIQKYKRSPIIAIEPEATAVLGVRGEHRQVEWKLKFRSNLLRHIQQAIPGILQGVALETLAEVSKPSRETKAQEKFLSPREASKMLGVSYKTLWRWAKKEGKIRYLELPSGRLRYYREEIENIAKEN